MASTATDTPACTPSARRYGASGRSSTPADGDGASLSPDGTKLAYRHWDGTTAHVSTSSTWTPASTRCPPSIRPPSAGLGDDEPTWSPDGARSCSERIVGAHDQLSVAPADRRSRRRRSGPTMAMRACAGVGRVLAGRLEGPRHYDADGSTWLLDPTDDARARSSPSPDHRHGDAGSDWRPDHRHRAAPDGRLARR